VHSENLLLNRLDPATFRKVAKSLINVRLERRQELAHPHEAVQRVYFPYSGVISCVVELPGGGAIETGMIGRDGHWGASQAMDDKVSLNAVIVQVDGSAAVMDADRLKLLATDLPEFRGLLLRYEQFFTAQVQQTAACNAVHSIEPKLAKWLLRMYELCGPVFPITQEFMAQMMGVRRTSVTGHAAELQKSGAISYSRGQITVTDPGLLKSRSCECSSELHSHFERLFGPEEHRQVNAIYVSDA
jgi:CRP-like cAMP-binding protein